MWLGDIGGLIRILFPLAIIGVIAVGAAMGCGLFWLITHVRFV